MVLKETPFLFICILLLWVKSVYSLAFRVNVVHNFTVLNLNELLLILTGFHFFTTRLFHGDCLPNFGS